MINKIVKRITLVSTLLLFFLILICNTSTLVFASETNSEMNVDELSLIDKYEISGNNLIIKSMDEQMVKIDGEIKEIKFIFVAKYVNILKSN